MATIRIKEHRTVKAKELVPHPLNWRLHPDRQKNVLRATLSEVGFARSVTAYEDPELGLVLIDGHLRAEIDPEADVVVEVLDVTPQEARKLLFAMDPIAGLAATHGDKRDALYASIQATTRQAEKALNSLMPKHAYQIEPKQQVRYHVLVECPNEAEQVKLLKRLQADGLECRAVVS